MRVDERSILSRTDRPVATHTNGLATSFRPPVKAQTYSTSSRPLRRLPRFSAFSLNRPSQRSIWFNHDYFGVQC